MGNLLQDQQRPDEAKAAYRQAIDRDPDDSLAYYNMGCMYALQEDVDHAIERDATCSESAQSDSDFDGIRAELSFQKLLRAAHAIDEN